MSNKLLTDVVFVWLTLLSLNKPRTSFEADDVLLWLQGKTKILPCTVEGRRSSCAAKARAEIRKCQPKAGPLSLVGSVS